MIALSKIFILCCSVLFECFGKKPLAASANELLHRQVMDLSDISEIFPEKPADGLLYPR